MPVSAVEFDLREWDSALQVLYLSVLGCQQGAEWVAMVELVWSVATAAAGLVPE